MTSVELKTETEKPEKHFWSRRREHVHAQRVKDKPKGTFSVL
jgi:hypothetical protein